jgi:hypothetical protein
MRVASLFKQTLIGCLLLVSGCDVYQNARGDFHRLTTSDPFVGQSSAATGARSAQSRTTSSPSKVASNAPTTSTTDAVSTKPDPAKDASAQTPINIVGKNESEVRAMLGPPTTVEERAPGKIWRYRDGQCTLAVQLYPDVQTRQFGTLSYEVKSDDNTAEGNRACMAQLRARTQSHG